jgi:hypothetical protein
MRRSTAISLAAVVAFAGFVFYSLSRVEPLKVEGQLERQGNRVYVRGRVTNTGSETQAAGLQLRLFDNSGHLVVRQTLHLATLGPGQSLEFSSPPTSASGAKKFTIQVDRGNNMYGN